MGNPNCLEKSANDQPVNLLDAHNRHVAVAAVTYMFLNNRRRLTPML